MLSIRGFVLLISNCHKKILNLKEYQILQTTQQSLSFLTGCLNHLQLVPVQAFLGSVQESQHLNLATQLYCSLYSPFPVTLTCQSIHFFSLLYSFSPKVKITSFFSYFPGNLPSQSISVLKITFSLSITLLNNSF